MSGDAMEVDNVIHVIKEIVQEIHLDVPLVLGQDRYLRMNIEVSVKKSNFFNKKIDIELKGSNKGAEPSTLSNTWINTVAQTSN